MRDPLLPSTDREDARRRGRLQAAAVIVALAVIAAALAALTGKKRARPAPPRAYDLEIEVITEAPDMGGADAGGVGQRDR